MKKYPQQVYCGQKLKAFSEQTKIQSIEWFDAYKSQKLVLCEKFVDIFSFTLPAASKSGTLR